MKKINMKYKVVWWHHRRRVNYVLQYEIYTNFLWLAKFLQWLGHHPDYNSTILIKR